MTPLIHKFEKGDRVKAVADMGWLKMDSLGIVTAVHSKGSTHEDAIFRDEEDTIVVAWPKSVYIQDIPDGATPWDGTVEGVGSIDTSDFNAPYFELTMYGRELSFIDNLLK